MAQLEPTPQIDISDNAENDSIWKRWFSDLSDTLISTLPGLFDFNTTWQIPSLQNSWVDLGGGFTGSRYRKHANGIIEIQGVIQSGTTAAGTTLFTLPTGFRPSDTLTFVQISNNAIARVDILNTGVVQIAGIAASSTYLNLTGIMFYADQ